jgi:hypothetical protein
MSIENIKMSDKIRIWGTSTLTGETQILDEVEVTGQASPPLVKPD